jgi:hypothetical protein
VERPRRAAPPPRVRRRHLPSPLPTTAPRARRRRSTARPRPARCCCFRHLESITAGVRVLIIDRGLKPAMIAFENKRKAIELQEEDDRILSPQVCTTMKIKLKKKVQLAPLLINIKSFSLFYQVLRTWLEPCPLLHCCISESSCKERDEENGREIKASW